MKIIVPFVTVLAVSAGSLAGVAAYQRTAEPDGADQVGVPVAQQEPAARVVPGATFGWAPCETPAVLREGACVTEVTRTVTLPTATPAPVAVAPAPAGFGDDAASDDAGSDDGGYDDDEDHEDHEDHEVEDHEVEDHEDD